MGAADEVAERLSPALRQGARVAALSLPPLVVSLWLSVPAFQPALQSAQGTVGRASSCVLLCADVIQIQGLLINCKADLLGVPYACDERLLRSGEAEATYAWLPSLAGLLGLTDVAGTLTKLQRDGKTVFARSVSSQVWAAMYGGWVFNAIYWPIAGLILWRWPQSRFSRRITWAASK